MQRASRRQKLGYPSNKTLYNMIQGELKVKNEPKKKKEEKVKPLSLIESSSSSDTEQEDQGGFVSRIKDPGDLQERRSKNNKKKKKTAEIEKILSQVRKFDKISYIEKSDEFEVQLKIIENQRLKKAQSQNKMRYI